MWCSSFGAAADLPTTMEVPPRGGRPRTSPARRPTRTPHAHTSARPHCRRTHPSGRTSLRAASLRAAPGSLIRPRAAVPQLNVFINTFELITEEKHTLSMAHLTGGETIAFEMVQGEHVSELSGFLLGDHVGRAKKGQGGAASGQAQLVLPGGVNAPAGILQPLAQARAASELKQKVDAAAQLSNQLAAASDSRDVARA